MSYNTSKLLTVADCDQAIAIATDRKDNLLFEQTVIERELSSKEKTSVLGRASLVSVRAEIMGAEAALAVLPEGPGKADMQSKLRRLNDRRENLEERLNKGGSVAVMDTELDAGLLIAQVAEIDQYITEVNARKAAL